MTEQKTEKPKKKHSAPKAEEVKEKAGKPEKGEKGGEKAEKAGAKPKGKRGKAKRRVVQTGKAHIQASYNNTIVTLTELNGNVIAWSSSGSSGFKGARKSTPYAAQVSAENAVEKAKAFGLENVHVFIKGVGTGREQAIRGLVSSGLNIISISDITPIPHNGCRKKKPRRV